MNGELIEGRIVHYILADGKTAPAIVTQILRTEKGEYLEHAGCVLTVFTGHGPFVVIANNDSDGKPGTWHWIDRAPEGDAEPDPNAPPIGAGLPGISY